MLTGRTPFQGKTAVVMMQGHLTEPPPRPSAKNPDIPKDLDNLVLGLMSKAPADRPWDAAAVAHRLRTLQDKDQRGEPIAMVFGPKLDAAKATDATAPLPQVAATAATAAARRKPAATERRLADLLSDPRVGTALLVAALLGLLGLGAYLFVITTWPSRETLYRKAEALMASTDAVDWSIALRDYIEPLDRRFPDHPYRQETRAWRDQILLHQATDRARILDAGLGAPKTPTEELYVAFSRQATEASKLGQTDQAAQLWRELADDARGPGRPEGAPVVPAGPQPRREAGGGSEAARQGRLKAVTRLLDLADERQKAGREAEAIQMRRNLLEQYGPAAASDPELARLLERARAGIPGHRPGPTGRRRRPSPAPRRRTPPRRR